MRWMMLAALMVGCSEYEMATSPDPVGADDPGALNPTDGDGTAGGATGTSGANGGGDGGGFGDDGGTGDQPDEFIDDDCLGGVTATWHSGEIYILENSPGPAVGELEVPQAGMYEIYDLALAESGPAQRNESAYIRVPTAGNPDGQPLFGNCDGEWVVEDSDNVAPPPAGTTQYLGTFWLDQGVNLVEMHHFCWLYQTGVCGAMHVIDDPASTCGSGNANSVHMTGMALCLRPAGG